MADQYGLVDLLARSYRNHTAACRAGVRRARSTGKPAYVGMLYDCRFHISDENPRSAGRGDWRWGTHMICQPDGSVRTQH